MAFDNFTTNVLNPGSPTAKNKKEEEAQASTGGFSNFKKSEGLEDPTPPKKTSPTPATQTETKTVKQKQVEQQVTPNPFPVSSRDILSPSIDAGFSSKTSTSAIPPVKIQPTEIQQKRELPKDEKISAAPVDNRPVDTVGAKIARKIVPDALEDELGIAPYQRKQPELSTRERILAAGTAQTQAMLEKNPQAVGYNEYLARGLSFGNNIDIYERYKEAKSGANLYLNVDDIPEPVTLKNKVAEGIGNTITMLAAEPLIAEAGAAILTKIPGGPKVLSKIAELSAPKAIPLAGGANTAFKSPGVKAVADRALDLAYTDGAAYVTSILKKGAIGSLFGLIQENKNSVARNVVTNAGLFAGFEALAYPIQAFFRPIMQTISKAEINNPNLSRALRDPSVTQEPIAKTIWFKNPKDSSQVMKVTANGVEFVPKNSAELTRAGVKPENLTTITRLDVEAFQAKPSLYDDLVSWISGEPPKNQKIAFSVKDNMAKPTDDAFLGDSPADDIADDLTSSEIRNEIEKINKAVQSGKATPEELIQYEKQLPSLQAGLNQFHSVSGQPSVVVNDDAGNRVAGISTVEYSDGKYAAKIEAGTPSQGITVDYNQNQLYSSEEKAIEAAKKEVVSWAKDTLPNVEDPVEAQTLQTIIEKVNKPSSKADVMVTPNEPGKIVLQENPLHERVMTELINAEKGQRIAVRKVDTAGFDFSRQASTFPKWIPKDLRRKPLLDAVAKHISDGTAPTKAAEKRLYDVVAKEMRAQDEALADQKFIQQLRNNVTNPIASEAENAAALTRFDAEYAKLQEGRPGRAEASGNAPETVVQPVPAKVEKPAQEKPVAAPKKKSVLPSKKKVGEPLKVIEEKTKNGGITKQFSRNPTLEERTNTIKEYKDNGYTNISFHGRFLTATEPVNKGGGSNASIGKFRSDTPVESGSAPAKPIYHATSTKFDKFDLSKMEGGVAYFTDSLKDFEGGNESGSVGTDIIMKRYLKPGLKLGGYDEADKFSTDELISQGYAGLKLEKDGSTWYEIFNPNEDLLTKPQVKKQSANGELPSEAEIKSQVEALPVYKGGGENADIGVFRDGTPVELGSMQSIKPIEMPEMVRLARELTGAFPTVKAKMGKKLGYFTPKGEGEIYLKADQFARGNEAAVAKLLAHEIGHLVDWLPDKTMARGNLIGRIFSLRKFMGSVFGTEDSLSGKQNLNLPRLRNDAFKSVLKQSPYRYGEYITSKAIRDELKPLVNARYKELLEASGAIKNADIKEELMLLSEYWRPYDKELSDSNYLKYRENPKELYADAISVLLNSPGTLEKMAPQFYKEFFGALDAKPDVKAAYFELQEILNGSTEEIFKARKEDIRKGFSRAEALQAEFEAKKKLKDFAFFERLRQQLDDINYPILKKQAEAEARGAFLPEENNPKFVLQEHSLADNENFLMVEAIDKNVVKPIQEAGMTLEDMGEYLLLDRIQKDRADIANPFGFNSKNAAQQLEALKKSVGEDNFKLLQEKVQYFHDLVFKSVEEAVKVGSYNKELFETKIKPNKDSYASFQVVDYMQDYVPATVKGQVGTLKEVANPFVSTILKTISLNRLNSLQRSKNAVLDLLKKNFPDEIADTKKITSDGKLSIFKPARDKGSIEVMEDGKMKSYDVDPYIAQSFKKEDVGTLAQITHTVLGIPNNVLFKPLFTTFNVGFTIFNAQRDFRDTYKLLPKETTIGSLLKAYVKAIPSSYKYAKGDLDEFTRSLVESKAIAAPMKDYNFDPREDEFGRILERYGLIKKDEPYTNAVAEAARKFLLKPTAKILDAVKFVGNIVEISGKIAGARERIRLGESGASLAYNLRNFTSTPNYRTRGQSTNLTNDIFLFSNINKEGWKRAYRMGTDPNTRSGYWWKTVKVDLLPKIIQWAAAAGLAGLGLKKFYDKVSEYDKTNYTIIPLGYYDADGGFSPATSDSAGKKAVYMRLPHDESGRLLAATMWKMMNFAKDRDTNNLSQIFSFGAGQIPNVTPAISIPTKWATYLSGENPYDSFRGRNIIDDTTFTAGGGAALKQMVKWTLNNTGLTRFATFDTSKQTGVETFAQVAPGVSAALKISDYGEQEKLNKVSDKQAKEGARQSLKDREIVDKYVKQAREDGSTIFKANKYRRDLVTEALGGHLPKNKEEEDYASRIMQRFTRSLKRGLNDDPRVDSIINSSSNAQKKEVIKSIKEDMSEDEFKAFKKGLIEDKIVTPELLYGIK